MNISKNKCVLVIGATSGIGEALVNKYVSLGFNVFAVGRRVALLEKLKKQHNSAIATQVFDVISGNATLLIKEVVAVFDKIDIVIYNSGFGKATNTFDSDIEIQTKQTNVMGFVNCCNASLNYFKEQGEGNFCAVSSVVAFIANSKAPSYSASKCFTSMYLKGVRQQIRVDHKNIFITDIRPGYVDTAMGQQGVIFWRISAAKAAIYIVMAIEKNKRVVYVSKRWRIVVWLFKLLNLNL